MDQSSTHTHDVQTDQYDLVLTNRLDDLTILSEWLSQLSSQLQISDRGAFRLDLVLSEAVTNIMNYAYADHEEHNIQVTLRHSDKTFTLELRDDGLPFDPLQQPEAQLPTCLEDATEGGLGIHLIRHYVNECRYHRDAHQNVLTMTLFDLD